MSITRLIIFLIIVFSFQQNAFAKLSGRQGSYVNEIKAYGSDDSDNNYDVDISSDYDASHIDSLNRSVQKRNMMSITKTTEALVELDQNLYGFYLDNEDVWNSSMRVSNGIYGTPYDCENNRDNIGNRFCEFIEFLEYSKNTDIKVILILPKYDEKELSTSRNRWLNSVDYPYDSTDATYFIRYWAQSLKDLAYDISELNSFYPNLAGFSVDDFDSKICSFEKKNPTDDPLSYCITKQEVKDIFDIMENETLGKANFYPLIYTERSNLLLHDAIVLGKSRDSVMNAGESLKVEVPLNVTVKKQGVGMSLPQYVFKAKNCAPNITGITSDSMIDESAVPLEEYIDAYSGIVKKMYFEYANGLVVDMYERSFLDTESYNDFLETYIKNISAETMGIPFKHNENVKLVFELTTKENLKSAINAIWSISNLSISCRDTSDSSYGSGYIFSIVPQIDQALGFFKGSLGGSQWRVIGNITLTDEQKKFFAGNTVNYHSGRGSTDEYDFASIINSYQLVWEWYGFEKNYTLTWNSDSEFESYFSKLFGLYHNKSSDFIFTMYGINEQLYKGDYQLKEVSSDVVKSYNGNFWYYKGGLELYFLGDSNNIGYMSHTEKDRASSLSSYENTIWIPQFSTKYPFYSACYYANLTGGYEHKIDLYKVLSGAQEYFKVNILLNGVLQSEPSWTSDNKSSYSIDLTSSATSVIAICVNDIYLIENGNQNVANRSSYFGLHFSLYDGSVDESLEVPSRIDQSNTTFDFFDPLVVSPTGPTVNKLWLSIQKSFGL